MNFAASSQRFSRNNRRGTCHPIGRLALAIGIAAGALVGPFSVSASAEEPKDPIEEARKKAADHADKLYGTTMKLNRDVATAINVVRAIIKQDPFAVIDILIDLMIGGDSGPPDLTVREATRKIIAEIRTVREEELLGRAESLFDRMGDLIINPQSMTFNDRLANYLDDSSDLYHELKAIMLNGDLERAEFVYGLVPTFNAVTSSRAVGLASSDLPQSRVDDLMGDAYETNEALVLDEDGNGQGGGYLYNVVQRSAGRFYCSTTQSWPIYCGGEVTCQWVDVFHEHEMDLTKGWELSNAWAEEASGIVYACDDPDATLGRYGKLMQSRFLADPIVHLINSSMLDQLRALGLVF